MSILLIFKNPIIILLNFSTFYLVCPQLLRNQVKRLLAQKVIFVSGGKNRVNEVLTSCFLAVLTSECCLTRLGLEVSLSADSPISGPVRYPIVEEAPCSGGEVNEGDI